MMVMASRALNNRGLVGAVEAAAEELVRVKRWGDMVYVNMPLVFPGGSFATVRVSPAPGGYRIDDGGFAYRELESIGAERSFRRTAAKIAEREGLDVNRRLIFCAADDADLQRAICDVAMASHSIAEQVYRKAAEQDEGEIEDYLQRRLAAIFGESKLADNRSIKGSSTTDWEVSAILKTDSHVTVFQAVGQNANSIYRANTAFHDLMELPSRPRLVAVVKDKGALGSKLNLLSQAGRVIEQDQPDSTYLKAAA
jgi:hypothetical protein